jgi:hypothetical protein
MQKHDQVKKRDVSIKKSASYNSFSDCRRIPVVDVNISNKIKQFQETVNESYERNAQDQINKQKQEAAMNVINVFVVGHGDKFTGTLDLEGLSRKINLETDKEGNFIINGKKMEGRDIYHGLKLYVIR